MDQDGNLLTNIDIHTSSIPMFLAIHICNCIQQKDSLWWHLANFPTILLAYWPPAWLLSATNTCRLPTGQFVFASYRLTDSTCLSASCMAPIGYCMADMILSSPLCFLASPLCLAAAAALFVLASWCCSICFGEQQLLFFASSPLLFSPLLSFLPMMKLSSPYIIWNEMMIKFGL